MYGVLYAHTPEVFLAPRCGTGGALCSALNRTGGFTTPLIKISIIPVSGSTSAAGKWSYLCVCCVVCGCSPLEDIASYRNYGQNGFMNLMHTTTSRANVCIRLETTMIQILSP